MRARNLLTILAICLPLAAGATDTLDVASLPAAVPAAVHTPGGTLKLDLDQAYAMALERNLNLQVGRYDVAIAGQSIVQRAGIFDPALTAAISGSKSKSPAATQLAGAQVTQSRGTSFDLGIGQLLPTGTQWDVSTNFARSETNSSYFFLNPSWQGQLNASITQPLLNGFGTTVNRSAIVVARNGHQQAATTFALNVIGTLQQVESSYWNLVAAREAVDVKKQSLDLAQQLLDETQERVKVGTAAPIDTVQSEASVASRTEELILARNAAANAEDTLKSVLGFDQPDEWTTGVATAEKLETEPIHPQLAGAIDTALKRRPELHRQLLGLATLELNLKVARNGILPSLDLRANYGYSGLGGDLVIEDPETGAIQRISGGYSDALQQITNMDYPAWTVGLNFRVPLGNNQAKAQVAQSRFQLEQARTSLESLKQQIILEVRKAVRDLEDGAAAIDAAAAAHKAAQRNLEAEQTKFANGLSTNFQVLQIQDDLALAQLSELNARVAYRRALVAYRIATGTMLEDKGIHIVEPDTPDVPHDFWKNVKWLQFVDFKGNGDTSADE